jgi:hypothetical protein
MDSSTAAGSNVARTMLLNMGDRTPAIVQMRSLSTRNSSPGQRAQARNCSTAFFSTAKARES